MSVGDSSVDVGADVSVGSCCAVDSFVDARVGICVGRRVGVGVMVRVGCRVLVGREARVGVGRSVLDGLDVGVIVGAWVAVGTSVSVGAGEAWLQALSTVSETATAINLLIGKPLSLSSMTLICVRPVVVKLDIGENARRWKKYLLTRA